MATKEYVAIFVPRKVRDAIKEEARRAGRTIIGELTIKYKVEI